MSDALYCRKCGDVMVASRWKSGKCQDCDEE